MPILLLITFAISALVYQNLHFNVTSPGSNTNIASNRLEAVDSNLYYYINSNLITLDESSILTMPPGTIDDSDNELLTSINYQKNGDYTSALIFESDSNSYLLVTWNEFNKKTINPASVISALANNMLLYRLKSKPIIGLNDNCELSSDYTFTATAIEISVAQEIFHNICTKAVNDYNVLVGKYIYLQRVS